MREDDHTTGECKRVMHPKRFKTYKHTNVPTGASLDADEEAEEETLSLAAASALSTATSRAASASSSALQNKSVK